MLAYRLISGESLLISRSFCPLCKHTIAWYDNIPLFSWVSLNGRCRHCHKPISLLYPFIELLTVVVFLIWALYGDMTYFVAYFIFFSALIVTIRTDLEHMLIPLGTSIQLVPVGLILSFFHLLPLTPFESLIGAGSAYIYLFVFNAIFKAIRRKNGLGLGDIYLLTCIGSFLGLIGWFFALSIGALLASLVGICYLLLCKLPKETPLPFGPFLALGAFLYTLFYTNIARFFYLS
jgi:leader peptidase (prepilin peptidase) / N-methyltransferase